VLVISVKYTYTLQRSSFNSRVCSLRACKRFISLEQREIFDNFSTRKNNLVIFTTQQGGPCDQGAHMLAKGGQLSRRHYSGRAKLSDKNRYLIVLIIEKHMSETMSKQIIIEIFLLNVITELNLTSVSIDKGNIELTPWHKIRDILDDTFRDHSRILICTN